MTQTLDLRDVLGESSSPHRRPGDRTNDLRTLLEQQGDRGSERLTVRNVVVMTGADRAHRSKSRAAFDLKRGAVIDVELPALAGGPDRERLAASITAHVVAGSLWAYGSASKSRRASVASTAVSLEPTDANVGAVDAAERIARSTFPAASRFAWSDDVDEMGAPYNLLSVVSPGSSHEIHEAYLAFVRAWVREEPPDRRSRIRVAYRAGVSG